MASNVRQKKAERAVENSTTLAAKVVNNNECSENGEPPENEMTENTPEARIQVY
jgi:hypothetical protein